MGKWDDAMRKHGAEMYAADEKAELLRIAREALESDEKATKGPLSVGYDGPSRPIICGPLPQNAMLSISRWDQGGWKSYDQEGADCDLFVHARTNYPKLARAVLELLEEPK